MAIATSTNLIGKNIVLLDGTKTKITDAMATGYKVAARTVRVNSKQVAKKGACFYEIPVTSLRDLVDSGDGYVSFSDKAMQKKVGTDELLEKPKASGRKTETAGAKPARRNAKPVEEAAPKTSNVRRKPQTDKVEEAKSTPRKAKKDSGTAYAELAEFLMRTESPKAKTVSLTEVNADLAKVITDRLVHTVKETSLAKFDANDMRIDNIYDVQYSTEFDSEGGDIRVVLHLKYALTAPEMPEPTAASFEFSAALMKKIKARVGKTTGKKLSIAIKELLGVDELEAGTILSREGEEGQFVYCGAGVDDSNKAVLFNTESEKFRTIAATLLSNYSVMTEEAEEETETDDEDEDEDEPEETDVSEDGEDDSDSTEDTEDGEEYDYAPITKKQLSAVDKEVTADNLDMLSELWGVPESALIAGLKLTDGDSTIVYIGMDEAGDLLVLEEDGKEVVAFDNADIPDLDDYAPVVGEETGAESEFDDSEDYSDLDEDELRDVVVRKGLTTIRNAAKMNVKKLRALLKAN